MALSTDTSKVAAASTNLEGLYRTATGSVAVVGLLALTGYRELVLAGPFAEETHQSFVAVPFFAFEILGHTVYGLP